MRRFLATVGTDARLQLRNGFYAAVAVVLGLWGILFGQLPLQVVDLGWLLPPLVAGNLVIGTFYFVGGQVLLEKTQGTLDAQVVTPLRIREYLGSKVVTLTALGLAENVALVAFLRGRSFDPWPLVLGIALASALYVLAGFIAVAPYEGINEYLLPSVVITAVLELPLVAYVGGWESWVVFLHPFTAPLALLRAAFLPVDGWQIAYGLTYGGLWVGLLAAASRRAFWRFVVARGGAA